MLRLCIHSAKVLIGHLKFSVFQLMGVISRKSLHLVERYFIIEMSNQTIILIGQLPQLRWREKDGYPYPVKSHLIIPFIWLKTGNNNKTLLFTVVFSKNSVYETPKLTFWVMNNVLSTFIKPQCHISNYSCLLLRTIATLKNEGTFVWVAIET